MYSRSDNERKVRESEMREPRDRVYEYECPKMRERKKGKLRYEAPTLSPKVRDREPIESQDKEIGYLLLRDTVVVR
jgi:Zn-finger domain-containing protein